MIKLAVVQMNSTVGDLAANAKRIVHFARQAYEQGAQLVLTPELGLVGYPPEDLLLREALYVETQQVLIQLAAELAELTDLHVLVGHPTLQQGKRFNAASLLVNGKVQATYCKHHLPNNEVFDEVRYFQAGQSVLVFELNHVQFGVAICEDAWNPVIPERIKAAGAQVLLVLNGSPYHVHKHALRYQVMREHVCQQGLAVVYANLVGGQDELIFDGHSFVLDQAGQLKAQLKHTEEEMQVVVFDGPTPQTALIEPPLSLEAQIYAALVLGVRDYVNKNGFVGVLLGLSGGVDSALTLAVAVDALGPDKVRAVMMPSMYTAEISLIDSREIAKNLGVHYEEISITPCYNTFMATLENQFQYLPVDATEENIQARIRGTLLMALSNKTGAIVLTTGNKSEMAVGYCTLYGDMAGGFAVLKDIAKTMVYRLCSYRNSMDVPVIPERILTRKPSAELRPNQTDQDSLPPYAILDGIMQLYMEENVSREGIIARGYNREDVERVTRLIKMNEYKRRQSPVGIRITHRAFGRDWRYPITSHFRD